jgi:alcohol dehydrogenase YqhD (iron-dependent ADH family)
MNPFSSYNPTKIVFGPDTVEQLGDLVKPYGTKILLVYGGGSIKKTGLYDAVMAQLTAIGATVHELPGVEPNPRLSTVHKGIAICRREQVDFILAVGGGSVIDAAKAVAVGVPYEGDVWDFCLRKAVIKASLPLGTILTLAATGSEMNGNAVISNWEEKQKRSFGSKLAYPRFSILDPTLTYTVPRDQTVNGIVDTMSHVFEQYFSPTADTPLQERFAESILQTVIENGEPALQNGSNYAARANLMLCSTMALNGTLAMGVVTDWATHAIEHEISAIYDIAHGAGLAIVFPNWMRYVYKERIDRFVQYAVRVWHIDPDGKSDDEIALAGIDATRAYFKRIGAPSSLSELQIGGQELDHMAEEAVHFGPIGSFKKLEKDDVKQILQMCL